MSCFGRRPWDPRGKHCYVTGGTSGLGLALALLLAEQGADVSIVAPDENGLPVAKEKLEGVRQSEDQRFADYNYDLTSADAAQDALRAVMDGHDGRVPDATFLCAGGATPKFFVEMTKEDLVRGLDMSYWVQAWTAWVVSQEMIKTHKKGKICFVSSTLGFMSVVGYASYAPGKHALRGLADTLRSEFKLYGIDVQIFFPCTMYTPGYERENQTKPKITLKLEEQDSGITATQAARRMLKGIKSHQSHITGDWTAEAFRASTQGSSPGHFLLKDWGLKILGCLVLPIWKWYVDMTVTGHAEEHDAYLRERGLRD